MMQAEDFFQKALEQIENGVFEGELDHGLHESDLPILRLSQTLNQLELPEEDPAVVQAQEVAFIQAASAQFPVQTDAEEGGKLGTLWVVALNRLQSVIGRSLLDSAQRWQLGTAALCLLVLIGAFLFFRPGEIEPPVDQLLEEELVPVEQLPVELEPIQPAPEAQVEAVPYPELDSQEGGQETQPGAESETSGSSMKLTLLEEPSLGNPSLFFPIVSMLSQQSANQAVLDQNDGLVQIQQTDGSWQTLLGSSNLEAGARLRTGPRSRATLTFFDGSFVNIGPESDLSLDQLNAQKPDQGFRTVVMTQWRGDSEHHVQFRNDGGSVYQVKTPDGEGIARGTIFRVTVNPVQGSSYVVTEGKVDVSSSGGRVSVTGGQGTSFRSGEPPVPPSFFISGRGLVESSGPVWVIAGQTFETNDRTLIVGNPQAGDLVRVEGRLRDDGGRVADRILLEAPNVTEQFSISGFVSEMDDTWTIAGQVIELDERVKIDSGIQVGDFVQVSGLVVGDGRFLAQTIRLQDEALGTPFSFSGLIQSQKGHYWRVSGQKIYLAEETRIDPGLMIGSLVAVSGWINIDSKWVALEIVAETLPTTTFAFQGVVTQINPWMIAGLPIEIDEWTMVDPAILPGMSVWVRGAILADGRYLALAITPVNSIDSQIVTFSGVLTGIDPWIVNNRLLQVTAETILLGDIQIGNRVTVEALRLPDGQLQALHIYGRDPLVGNGCFSLYSPVVAVNNGGIQIRHWPDLIVSNSVLRLSDGLKINDTIALTLCQTFNGPILVTGEIVLIYRPIVVIINDGNSGGGSLPSGCRITPKGNIKCSDRESKKSKESD